MEGFLVTETFIVLMVTVATQNDGQIKAFDPENINWRADAGRRRPASTSS